MQFYNRCHLFYNYETKCACLLRGYIRIYRHVDGTLQLVSIVLYYYYYCYHIYTQHLQLHTRNKPYFLQYRVMEGSVVTVCATCNVIGYNRSFVLITSALPAVCVVCGVWCVCVWCVWCVVCVVYVCGVCLFVHERVKPVLNETWRERNPVFGGKFSQSDDL